MRNGGFTIVEVIIGMAILSVAMLIATLGFTTIVRLQEKAQTAQNIQQNARYIAEAINRDVRS
jgi:prepilin-type N-terminal cleavage/methylation domain-containing protein